jgi:hypothetical protein
MPEAHIFPARSRFTTSRSVMKDSSELSSGPNAEKMVRKNRMPTCGASAAVSR